MTTDVETQQLPTPRFSEVADWSRKTRELCEQITQYRELWQKEDRPDWYPMIDLAEDHLFHLSRVLSYLQQQVGYGD